MSAPASRRSFLSGLATLPLIGGSVALIGSPTAAAEPMTRAVLDAYDEFLVGERSALRWERFGPTPPEGDQRPYGSDVVLYDTVSDRVFDYSSMVTPASRFHRFERHQGPGSASARAALVLATVGCDWREGGL